MSTVVAFPIQLTTWTAFWMQLPMLALIVAVVIVALTALRKARAEDVPKIFDAFALGFGRRLDPTPPARQQKWAEATVSEEEPR